MKGAVNPASAISNIKKAHPTMVKQNVLQMAKDYTTTVKRLDPFF